MIDNDDASGLLRDVQKRMRHAHTCGWQMNKACSCGYDALIARITAYLATPAPKPMYQCPFCRAEHNLLPTQSIRSQPVPVEPNVCKRGCTVNCGSCGYPPDYGNSLPIEPEITLACEYDNEDSVVARPDYNALRSRYAALQSRSIMIATAYDELDAEIKAIRDQPMPVEPGMIQAMRSGSVVFPDAQQGEVINYIDTLQSALQVAQQERDTLMIAYDQVCVERSLRGNALDKAERDRENCYDSLEIARRKLLEIKELIMKGAKQ